MPNLPVRFFPTVDYISATSRGLAVTHPGGEPHTFNRTRRRSLITYLLFLAVTAGVLLNAAPARAQLLWPLCCIGATNALGQQKIDQGYYQDAIDVFSCVMYSNPQSIDAYRGRAEAKLLLNRYSDAFADYALLTAVVIPEDPTAPDTILASYDTRLAASPNNVPALTGASFARWAFFDYEGSLALAGTLLSLNSNNLYAKLFRGSNRLFLGENVSGGRADLDAAISLSPWNAHVRYIVADAYTYADPNPSRALTEASNALQWGLDTPRVHAILAASYFASNNQSSAAYHLDQHIDLVTDDLDYTSSLSSGGSKTLELVPYQTYQIPLPVTSGQTVSIRTSSPNDEIFDTILVVLDCNGNPVTGNDDFTDFYAGFDWVAPSTGTYYMRVTTFEGVGTGGILVQRL